MEDMDVKPVVIFPRLLLKVVGGGFVADKGLKGGRCNEAHQGVQAYSKTKRKAFCVLRVPNRKEVCRMKIRTFLLLIR